MDPKKLTSTETEKNLWVAFSGESQARNKYTYFAAVARKEGYHQIAALFEETADNEKQHAKLWFKHLNGIGDTAANLKSAAEGVTPIILAALAKVLSSAAARKILSCRRSTGSDDIAHYV